MENNGSVTGWLDGLRRGDKVAAQKCWESYFDRLVNLARAKLEGKPRTLQEPEDIALSAFKSFCLAAQKGKFPRLDDRHDLWQVLVMLTHRKTIDALRREHAGGRPPIVSLPSPSTGDSSDGVSILDIIGNEPTPAFAAEVAEQKQRLLAQLPNDKFRKIVELKLEGYTNVEIAAELKWSLATIERKLALVRRTWEETNPHDS